jgi:hypothetical protein
MDLSSNADLLLRAVHGRPETGKLPGVAWRAAGMESDETDLEALPVMSGRSGKAVILSVMKWGTLVSPPSACTPQ